MSYLKIFLLLIFINQNKDIHINPSDAYNQLNSNDDIILIDVRTDEEIKISKISGSISIDFNSESFYDSLLTLNKSKIYFIYCRSGRRSTIAVKYMRENGFHESYNVDGGINLWKNQNLDLKPKKKANN